MEKIRCIRENIMTALEVPEDLTCGEVMITIMGREEVLIENYKTIVKYTKDEILITAQGGKVKIYGSNLEILFCSSDEMKVKGRLSGVGFGI